MHKTARALAGLGKDLRGTSFLEFVSTAAVLGGILVVASTTFERELRILIGSVRAAVVGFLR